MVHQRKAPAGGKRLAGGRRPVGQAVKTAASHAANVGSIPARVTKGFPRRRPGARGKRE